MGRLRKRFKKYKTCLVTLRKEARFYGGKWKDERIEACGAPLTHEIEQITSVCDCCRFGGQALLGAVPQESIEEVARRAQWVKGSK